MEPQREISDTRRKRRESRGNPMGVAPMGNSSSAVVVLDPSDGFPAEAATADVRTAEY